MKDTASQDEIAAATAYEDLHVPALFRQWAPRVVDAAQIRMGCRVLDVACGTESLLEKLRCAWETKDSWPALTSVPECWRWLSGWLRRLSGGKARRNRYLMRRNRSTRSSAFGMMSFQDRGTALREMMRVLAPGGRMAVAVWESLDKSEAYPREVALLERLAGQRAADALRAPFVLGDRAELNTLFEDAGVGSIEIATHRGTARFPSIRTMVEADVRGWLPVMGVVLTEEQIESILSEAEQALSEYVTPVGTVEFDSPAYIVTGMKS